MRHREAQRECDKCHKKGTARTLIVLGNSKALCSECVDKWVSFSEKKLLRYNTDDKVEFRQAWIELFGKFAGRRSDRLVDSFSLLESTFKTRIRDGMYNLRRL
jgi:hypothetical protein